MNENSKAVMNCKAVYKIIIWFTMRYDYQKTLLFLEEWWEGVAILITYNILHKNVSMLLHKVHMKFVLRKFHWEHKS